MQIYNAKKHLHAFFAWKKLGNQTYEFKEIKFLCVHLNTSSKFFVFIFPLKIF